jgi:hypothetical protein
LSESGELGKVLRGFFCVDVPFSAKVPKGIFSIYRRASKNPEMDPERSTQEIRKDMPSYNLFDKTRGLRNVVRGLNVSENKSYCMYTLVVLYKITKA